MRTTSLVAMGLMMMATTAVPQTAEACGGCFHTSTVEGGSESTVVTAHRMAVSISPTQTVLWDQIQYSGNPEEFAWVLPVMPGTVVEVGTAAWFDVLEAGTSSAVGAEAECWSSSGFGSGGGSSGSSGRPDEGFGCGSDGPAPPSSGEFFGGGGASAGGSGYDQEAPPDPVTVVSQATVGPYETVTLSTEEPGALNEWLTSHGYAIPEDITPIIDAYVSEGFDFIALRLVPGNDVRQMQPVRVVMPGPQLTLPLRLVAAGTGAQTALTLFVLSEGRYETQNFTNDLILPDQLSWNWNSSSSNYAEVRRDTLAQNEGRTWLTSYARQGSLFMPVVDAASPTPVNLTYNLPNAPSTDRMANAYALSTVGTDDCAVAFADAAADNLLIVDDCATGECLPVNEGEIALSEIDCGPEADDLGRALTGLHAGDVWVTRLEADLPRAALDQDLQLMAADEQATVAGRFMAQKWVGDPCAGSGSVSGASLGGGTAERRLPGGLVGLSLAALGAAFALRRRRSFLAD